MELQISEIFLRLLCAMIVGLIIGTEREYTHRPAGMRTHILVALGSCAVMITGELIFAEYKAYGAMPDPARLSAQVITGVGFLGAGTILREGPSVKGLTTAASLWSVACLGIAAGAGYYHIALVGMVLMFMTLTLLEVLQNLLMRGGKGHEKGYEVMASDAAAAVNAINCMAELCACRISDIAMDNLEDGLRIRFHAQFGAGGRKRRQQRFMDGLAADPAISSIQLAEAPIHA